MEFKHYMLLLGVFRLNGERTLNGVLHLLKGKRSAQTIQDISFFKCEDIAASLKRYSFLELQKLSSQLLKDNLIEESSSKTVQMTAVGNTQFMTLSEHFYFPESFNGLAYEWSHSAAFFWEQLSLLIQTISYVKDKRFDFLPVATKSVTQQQVKQVIRSKKGTGWLGQRLYQELEQILDSMPDIHATLFVHKLTSSKRVGRTFSQLSQPFNKDPYFTELIFWSTIHKVIKEIDQSPESFPTLSLLRPREINQEFVTNTARITKDLLDKGLSMDKIASIRKLKDSTIEDHIVELAIHDSTFDVSTFISEDSIELIQQTAVSLKTSRLKPIKDNLGGEFDYFQIRLALSGKSKGELKT